MTLEEAKEHFRKTIDFFLQEISILRTGRAAPSLIEHIRAEYYGTPTPLLQLASISAPEPGLLVVQPWDASVVPAIEKALRQSDLGLNPVVEGTLLRIPLPSLTEERRLDLVKIVGQKAEAARVAIRSTREEAVKNIRDQEKSGTMSEDIAETQRKEVQKFVEQANEKILSSTKKKEQEITQLSS